MHAGMLAVWGISPKDAWTVELAGLVAAALSILVFIVARRHVIHRLFGNEALAADAVALLESGDSTRASSVVQEADRGFAGPAGQAVAGGSEAYVPEPPREDGGDFQELAALWALRCVALAGTLLGLTLLNDWFWRDVWRVGTRYGPASVPLRPLGTVLMLALPAVVSYVLLRRLQDVRWWGEVRRAELLIEIAKSRPTPPSTPSTT